MGKVTIKELPKDHPIFKSGWLIATARHQSQKIKVYEKSKQTINPKKARYTLWPRRFSRHHTERGENAIEKYVNLADKHGIAPSTFANAFVNDRPFVTSNIIGATTMDQLKENIDSIEITLSKEVLKEIEDIHLSDPNPCV